MISFIVVIHFLAPITCVSLTHDGQCILVSSADNSVKLFDKNTGELLSEYVIVLHIRESFNK